MARSSGAPVTDMPGPFLGRPREEIKCEPDKEIPFSSDARESKVMIPPRTTQTKLARALDHGASHTWGAFFSVMTALASQA